MPCHDVSHPLKGTLHSGAGLVPDIDGGDRGTLDSAQGSHDGTQLKPLLRRSPCVIEVELQANRTKTCSLQATRHEGAGLRATGLFQAHSPTHTPTCTLALRPQVVPTWMPSEFCTANTQSRTLCWPQQSQLRVNKNAIHLLSCNKSTTQACPSCPC